MSHAPTIAPALRVTDLDPGKPTQFEVAPDPKARAVLCRELGLLGLQKLRFKGQFDLDQAGDWRLRARLGATVIQACTITLAPVKTRIKEVVERRFFADFPAPEEAETEMDSDDTIEPLGDRIDLGAILTEALALALPAWPRAPGAELGEVTVAAPGVEPLSESVMRPFAGLGNLRNKLAGKR